MLFTITVNADQLTLLRLLHLNNTKVRHLKS